MLTPMSSFAFDLGASSSGNDISIDFWTGINESQKIGLYSRTVIDFESYEGDDYVSVCGDGEVSGSTGSGTCSGHSGVSSTKLAEFSRIALIFGPTYKLSETIDIYGGIIIGFYSSDVSIGDSASLDYSKYGADIGLRLKPIKSSDIKITLSYETEQNRTSVGFSYPIF